MRLGDYLDKELIVSEMTSASKAEVLQELVGCIANKLEGFDATQAITVLMEREGLGTTGIGDGVAIPHGKMPGLEEIYVVVGRSASGIDFEALDQAPCHYFFLVLAPEQVAGQHLRILAQISRLLKDPDFKNNFLAAQDDDALWSLLLGV